MDELLEALREEIKATDIDATAFAKLWIGVGLQIAAQVVEDKRIAILCELIVSNERSAD